MTNAVNNPTADAVLTEADMQGVWDAIDELVSETQTKPFLVDTGLKSGAPAVALV